MLAPYKPRHLPMRLFVLEYYRYIINVYEFNFFNAKKKAYFKIKDQLGPFICNSREAGKEVDLILQRMKFQRSFEWRYDPLEFITKKRQKVKLGPFIHHSILKIEAYANQTECVEGTVITPRNSPRLYNRDAREHYKLNKNVLKWWMNERNAAY